MCDTILRVRRPFVGSLRSIESSIGTVLHILEVVERLNEISVTLYLQSMLFVKSCLPYGAIAIIHVKYNV